ncbi:MAG: peptidase M3, partial [Clostridia bacterium]|nr:peptidase M3 [Clostridia bacterium]
MMYNEWSLDVLYRGIDDPKLSKDMEALERAIASYKAAVSSLTYDDPRKSLVTVITLKEEMGLLTRRLFSYFSLRRSVNSADKEGALYQTKLQTMLTATAKENVQFQKYVGGIEDLDSVIAKDTLLSEYRFYFSEIKESLSHTMSDESEALFARMNLSGGKAWSDLMSYLTAGVEVDYQGEKKTLSAIRALAESDSREVRKEAYEAELRAYDKIKDAIAFSLNSIKAQVNLEAELRGYENPLAMTLADSRMQKETLQAMFAAMREFMPKFREYLKHKAKLLGYEAGLPWYEILAPMGKADAKTYTAEEAHSYLVEHFATFAPDLAEMVDKAFREEWIDFYPRAGKVGGAFCSNLPFVGESRILTNFAGTFGSVVTLAHELGHAYHGLQIQSHRPLNTGYTMPVAETASNFNELIIVNDAIAKATGEEKIRLIESQIQDCTQIIVDIYSRFLFEDEVIRRRNTTFMFAKDLE